MALLWIVVLGFGHASMWLLIIMGAGTALGLESAASISLRIRRAGARGYDESGRSKLTYYPPPAYPSAAVRWDQVLRRPWRWTE
jgi:hypothetical protein